ncbi:DUF2155 domain-containing protein [Brevundimonas sp. FT23042]|uniref:DUF2155 domain-containing protein n=1 Tax=Brevundimonas sp. FT23042 TaxID=3393749 RepID=UPI003B58A108
MRHRGLILTGFSAAAILVAGGVVASALNDIPQDARPIQDTTAELNRQSTPPAEPAPEAAPAPTTPVAITPVTPPVTPAPTPAPEKAEGAEDAATEEVTEARPDPAAPPGRRQRRRVAIVEAVNKVTTERMRFEVEVGGRPVRFQPSLIFTARACEVSASDEQVEDAIAYLEVSIQPRGTQQNTGPRQIFRGWMFASSPAVSGLQHPIYDAWIVGCKA